jgi:exportin 1-like protein
LLTRDALERSLVSRHQHPAIRRRRRGKDLRGDDTARKGWTTTRSLGGKQCADKRQLTYDLGTDISEGELAALREQILLLLKHYTAGPRPIRVQLCVCLAVFAIHMQTWKNVLSDVVEALEGPGSHVVILDFLRILPEEVTEGRKITLSVRGPAKYPFRLSRHAPRPSRVRSPSGIPVLIRHGRKKSCRRGPWSS